MVDMHISQPIPVEDIQKSVEVSHQENMDTSENDHQASEHYGPFNGLQAMEDVLYPPSPSSTRRQYSRKNFPVTMVTETGSQLPLTLEVNNKLSVQQSENMSGSDGSGSSIPQAKELSIQPCGLDCIILNPQTDDTDMKYDGEWDSTYQPMDEPLTPLSTEMAIPGKKRANSITHDHSYGSSRWTNIDTQKDEDLHKDLSLNSSIKNVQKSRRKHTPTNTQDSQKTKNCLRNKKNLLRELRHIRVEADIRKLPTDKLRQLVPRLVRLLYYEQDDPKRKGIYKVAPPDWPEGKFFGEPCNRKAGGGRPRKDMITEMSCELFTRYQKTQACSTDDVNGAVDAC